MYLIDEYNNPPMSGDITIDSLVQGGSPWNYLLPHRNTLYYSFDTNGIDWYALGLQPPIAPFNALQQQASHDILSYVGGLTGIDFAYTVSSNQADIRFANVDLPGSYYSGMHYGSESYRFFEGDPTFSSFSVSSLILLDNVEHADSNAAPLPGTTGYETLLHEVGHMLGLAHPFEGTHVLPPALDHTDNTVMSYTRSGASKSEFQSFDLAALSWLYGGDGIAGNWGQNSVYGPLSREVASTALDDIFRGELGIESVVFSGSIDEYVIRIDRSTQTVTVEDLVAGRNGSDTLVSINNIVFGDETFSVINPAREAVPQYGVSRDFLFDPAFYLLSNPELPPAVTLESASAHFLEIGAAQGRSPNSWFDPDYYGGRWDDLSSLDLDDATLFLHYNLYGVWEGRSAGPRFDRYDGNRYLQENPDVAAYVDAHVQDFLGSRSNGAIAHYVIYGADEGRLAFDVFGNPIETIIVVGGVADGSTMI